MLHQLLEKFEIICDSGVIPFFGWRFVGFFQVFTWAHRGVQQLEEDCLSLFGCNFSDGKIEGGAAMGGAGLSLSWVNISLLWRVGLLLRLN